MADSINPSAPPHTTKEPPDWALDEREAWLAGYRLGKAGKPPSLLSVTFQSAVNVGYAVGACDRRNDQPMDEWEAANG